MFVMPGSTTSGLKTETSPQGVRYERTLVNGSLLETDQTPRQITTVRARPITRERSRGSLEATFFKTGCQEVPLHGFMEDVCPPTLLLCCQLLMLRDLHSRLREEHPLVCLFPNIVAKFEISC